MSRNINKTGGNYSRHFANLELINILMPIDLTSPVIFPSQQSLQLSPLMKILW